MAACGGNSEENTDAADTGNNSGSENADTSNENNGGNAEAGGDYPELEITFSHNQPEDSPEHAGALAFQEYIEGESGGSVTVDLYPDSQMGSLREQVESTQIGEIDITMQPSAVVSPFVENVKLVDFPYLWPEDIDQKYEVQDSEVGEELLTELEDGGFSGLGYWPGGFKLFTTNGQEIHEPSDFEGLTMRTMEAPTLINQYEYWGGNAEPVAYAEVFNALQQGVVDGQENPLQTIYLNDYHTVQDYVIESYHGTMTYLLMANQGWFEGLDENVQQLISDAEAEGVEAARTNLAETEDEYRTAIDESDAEYYELTDEELDTFREMSREFHQEEVSNDRQQELLDMLYEEIESVTGGE
ncbi:C4-dicarboxylate ABC transporter substrate-binding protein [Alkalicoccus urumqiensis]|uniref:C4-dicarboxylate ABC transporter substrate-binding protein n=1 Tax=Alkalicoccus urumqiensis TaxID=1548213 RepID=A0A2P6MM28_ALKUR|nr:C4-dicarboxylate ABC transporter substrate-binding protein [Alkalicoccus urumqiensis]